MGTMVSQGRMWYELDACPFCGGKAILKDMGNNRLHIYCSSCPVRLGSTWGSDESLEYLAAAWNKRVTPDACDHSSGTCPACDNRNKTWDEQRGVSGR